MTDVVTQAIYRMGMDASQYIQAADAVDQANEQIIASTEKVAAAEESATVWTQRVGDEFSRLEARQDRLIQIEQRRKTAIEQANRVAQEEGITTQRLSAYIDTLNAKASASVQAELARRSAFTAGTQVTRNFGSAIQQAGFQVGDFAVQVASGGGILRPFIQQGTQLISMFGPWGAVIGAAGAVIGALAVSFVGLGESEEDAKKALKEFEKAMDDANSILLTGAELSELNRQLKIDETKATISSTIETQKDTVARLENALALREQIDAARPGPGAFDDLSFIGAGNSDALPGAEEAFQRVAEAEAKLELLQEKLARISDPSQSGAMREFLQKQAEDAAKEAERAGQKMEQEAERRRKESLRNADDFAKSLAAVQEKINPAAGAEKALEKDLITLDLAFERGKIGIDEYNSSVSLLYKSYADKLDPVQASYDKLTKSQSELIRQKEAEAKAIGMTSVERAEYLAGVEAENRLLAEGRDLSDQRSQAYINNAKAIARGTEAMKVEQKATGELTGFIDQSFDRIGSAITEAFATGEIKATNFLDVGRAVVSELEQAFWKLALINPLKNWLNGNSDLPDISGVFSAIGGLFTGGGTIGPTSIGYGGGPGGFFADGGRPPVGRASIVGERGPEWFVPDQAGTIYPNGMSPGGQTKIEIYDQRTGGADVEHQETTDASGQRVIKMFIRDEVKSLFNNGSMDKTMDRYGVKAQPLKRRS